VKERFLAVGILLASILTVATAQPPESFFPHNTGDMWEYFWVEPGYPDTLQSFMFQDSVGIDGRIYATKDSRFINPVMHFWTDRYVIDTTLKQVWGDLGYGFGVLYKLDARQGDQWVMIDHGGGYEICRVVNVRQATLFGIPTIIKDYRYFLALDSTDTSGLSRGGHSVASGFGLTYMGGGDLFYSIYLKGAVINGILYGDTTFVVTSVPDVSTNFPSQFELSPNFPNPFNPSTTIRFKLLGSSRVTLIVYDGLGREIRRLINDEKFDSGNHEVTWDGKKDSAEKTSSGVYYYRLFGNGNSITRSMMLLK